MELTEKFKDYLLHQPYPTSALTIKNYLADIKRFIRWYEKVTHQSFIPEAITYEIIQSYRQSFDSDEVSSVSVNRYLSSLRKFFTFLQTEKIITTHPFSVTTDEDILFEKFHFSLFKSYLIEHQAALLTVKNYLIDFKQAVAWADSENLLPHKLNEKSLTSFIATYRAYLIRNDFSEATINRKVFSLKKYQQFVLDTYVHPIKPTEQTSLSSETHETQANLGAGTPLPQDAWWRKTQTHARAYLQEKKPLLHLTPSLLLPIAGATSLLIGSTLSYTQVKEYIAHSYLPKSETRTPFTITFAFSGKMLTSTHKPVTEPVDVTFAIFSDPEKKDNSSIIWKDTVKVIPERDGAFSVVLGTGRPISASILAQKHDLYLGALIGDKEVVSKRQSIATSTPIRIIKK